MSGRQESKITRLDIRIPNDVYAQVEEIAKANNEPTHHITGNIILTPTVVKLIRLGILSIADNYPALADLPAASGQVPDRLTPRLESIERELLDKFRELESRLSDIQPTTTGLDTEGVEKLVNASIEMASEPIAHSIEELRSELSEVSEFARNLQGEIVKVKKPLAIV
jgi:hypothetical protein